MHFEFFEIEDNFCPNYASDPYRRVHIRTRVNVKEGQTMKDAQEAAETFIKEYIYDHTVSTPPSTYTYPLEPIPDRQVEKDAELIGQSLEEQISTCTEIKVLESYKFIVKGNSFYQDVYEKKMQELLLKENLKQL